MAQTQVKVVEVFADHLMVSGQRTGGCSACAQRSHCGVKGAELERKQDFTFAVPYTIEEHGIVRVGQHLAVQCNESHLLKAIVTLFGPPLVGLITVPSLWWMCNSVTPSDLSTAIASCVGVVAGLAVSRMIAKQMSKNSHLSADNISLVTNPTNEE